MEFIDCPSCGAYNQRGVTFCINCGCILPFTERRTKHEADPSEPGDARHASRRPDSTQGSLKDPGIHFAASADVAPSFEALLVRHGNALSRKPDDATPQGAEAELTADRAQDRCVPTPDAAVRPEFAPLPGSGFETALEKASEATKALYLAIMSYVEDLPYEISFSPRSHHTTFELVDGKGGRAVFGSVRQPTKTYVAINLKPGKRGFAYGENNAALAPKEESPDKLFRNVKGVGHWGAGNLEIRLTPRHIYNGMLPQVVRDAIDDAARVASGK